MQGSIYQPDSVQVYWQVQNTLCYFLLPNKMGCCRRYGYSTEPRPWGDEDLTTAAPTLDPANESDAWVDGYDGASTTAAPTAGPTTEVQGTLQLEFADITVLQDLLADPVKLETTKAAICLLYTSPSPRDRG